MSSNIKVQRICEHCGNEFTARTTVTRFCSHKCANAAHKQRLRVDKIKSSNKQTRQIIIQPIEQLKAKEFLTVREVSHLLNCSVRSVYYYINSGTIKAINLGKRMTRVKRSDIDKLFNQTEPAAPQQKQTEFKISDCYTLIDVQEKFGISAKALQEIIKRNGIPKIKKGRFAYIPKTVIEKILS